MERITTKDVDRLAETISEHLEENLSIQRQGRNGYQGLDLYWRESLQRTLHCGTTREVYTYLQGWRRGQLEA